MKTLDTLIAALGKWTENHPYSTTQVTVEPTKLDTAESLEKLLGGLEKPVGWIARQSGVVSISNSDHADDPTLGDVVSAELTSGKHSLQVRRLPHGWSVTTIIEGSGAECLCDDIVHATLEHGAARYRRYWERPETGAIQVFAWRFVGFEEIA